MARKPLLTTIRTEGGLLPSDLLARVASDDQHLPGLSPEDYHLPKGERLGEAITRSWNRLVGVWTSFQAHLEDTKPDDAATGLTRDRFLLPLFAELGFGRLAPSKGLAVDNVSFPVSHAWGAVPIHLVGARVDVDRRTAGVAGAARSSPHSLVQDLLNRSDEYLWGIVANGERMRLLRDNSSMTRQAFVEFDLASMFEGGVYADFVVLWLTCHQSRFEAERPEACLLERWTLAAAEHGTRVLEQLRDGVERAIQHLGQGFLSHHSNGVLREALRSGELSTQDYYRQLLRVVYRLLFLFTAEDRNVLLSPGADALARGRFVRYYSTTRLRSLARARRGSAHPDLWRTLRIVMDALGNQGRPELGLPALGSFLWSGDAVADVEGRELFNKDLLAAVAALAFTKDRQEKVARDVDYRNLGAEELGSVYESLLELHPDVNLAAATFTLSSAAGHERKVTGSYYTPTSLITVLLDSALDPLLDEAVKEDDPEESLLDLKVCDPACGSGHFLIAAAHRIARRLAIVRTADPEPGPGPMRTAIRDVIGRCIYGIDVNPMAVELCKVSMWLEALEPGKPLSFLDHRIACGNSLLGATPKLLDEGIPDDAFKSLTGDDKTVASELRKRNMAERSGQATLEFAFTAANLADPLSAEIRAIDEIDDADVDGVRSKEERWRKLVDGAEATHARLVADAWCASFVVPKRKGEPAITQDVVDRLRQGPDRVAVDVREVIERAAERYRFLHWYLAFPDVFRLGGDDEPRPETGWRGGFDLVCGNPPWEKVQLEERQFFAPFNPDIAAAAGAKRKRMIAALKSEDPPLYEAYQAALRDADAESLFLRSSGRFPLCGQGRINLYAVFAEAMQHAAGPTGFVGCIVPSGIATDDTTKLFFRDLVDRKSLASLYDFRNKGFFPAVASAQGIRFCLLTTTGRGRPVVEATFLFRAEAVAELLDPERRFALAPDDFELLNPNTRTCPIFRTERDAEITKKIYRWAGVLIDESESEAAGNPWSVSFMQGLFNMTSDSHMFRSRDDLESDGYELHGNIFVRGNERALPLYEAKMIHHYNHRFGDYALAPKTDRQVRQLPNASAEQLVDPAYTVLPRYWVPFGEVDAHLRDRWDRDWLLGWRDVTSSLDERTVIAGVIPRAAVGHKFPLVFPSGPAHVLLALLSSFVLDYAARQKLGSTSLTFFIVKQLPVLRPGIFETPCPWETALTTADWIAERVLELVYTSNDMAAFARDLGYEGPPFPWDSTRRSDLRSELDAAFFHLYGLDRDEVDYIMDTFPIVRRKDEATHGSYRTKEMILASYDELATVADRSA